MERQRSKETGQQRNIKRRNIKTETDPEKKERGRERQTYVKTERYNRRKYSALPQ